MGKTTKAMKPCTIAYTKTMGKTTKSTKTMGKTTKAMKSGTVYTNNLVSRSSSNEKF